MSVNFTWIIAMRMLLAMTLLGASVVPATLDLKEMESTVIVSLTLFLRKSMKKKIVSLHYITWNTVLVYIDISCLSLHHGTEVVRFECTNSNWVIW